MARRFFYLAFLVLLGVVGTVPVAHAYIDPAGGGYLLQIILGGFFAFAAVLATFWHRVKALVARPFGRKDAGGAAESSQTERT